MQSVRLQSHVGQDGILRLELPLDIVNTDVELLIVFQPILSEPQSPQELGWPPDFFEKTFGSFKDEPLQRPPQGQTIDDIFDRARENWPPDNEAMNETDVR